MIPLGRLNSSDQTHIVMQETPLPIVLQPKSITESATIRNANILTYLCYAILFIQASSATLIDAFPDYAKWVNLANGLSTAAISVFGVQSAGKVREARLSLGDLTSAPGQVGRDIASIAATAYVNEQVQAIAQPIVNSAVDSVSDIPRRLIAQAGEDEM